MAQLLLISFPMINILLILITLLSFLLRVVNINFPPLLWDEAALGYNAYSIIKTGMDEFGKFLPLIFKSFGDYKPGLYVYLAIPFVKLFGLNELSVRLPSILIGSITPLLAYLLVTKSNKKNKILGIIFALLIAINPYNIHYSRGAWETNILTFELLLASYLFFSNKLLLSSIIFGLTLYTYQSGKLISLLIIISLFLLNIEGIKNNISKILLRFILPLFIFCLPVIYGLLFSHNSNRLKVVSLFSYPRSQQETATILSESNTTDFQIFHSQAIFFSRNFSSRYFNNFSPRFLFFEGDWQNPRHSAPYIGVLLIPNIIFLIVGIIYILYKKNKTKLEVFMIIWLLIAPIPSSLTRDSIQATRAMSMSIPLLYMCAQGLYLLINLINKNLYKKIFITAIIIIYSISLTYYFDLYFNHMVKKSPNDFLYGYKQAAEFIIKHGNNKQIFFTDFYGQPYIYYLFYSQYPPQKYQSQNTYQESSVDTGRVNKIDDISFMTPQYSDLKNKTNTLSIFSWDEILRQGINNNQQEFSKFIPLSKINNISTFYGYEN